MATTRQIRSRIRVAKNIQQITKAMKMVAAARLKRAQDRVQAARPYSSKMREVMTSLAGAASSEIEHPLLESREVLNIGVLVITADRGLAGSYNSGIMRLAVEFMKDHEKSRVKMYIVGKKGNAFFSRRGYNIVENLTINSNAVAFSEAVEITRVVREAFISGDIDELYVLSTKFGSAITQTPQVMKLLPIETPKAAEGESAEASNYIFEPEPEVLLGELLPRYVVNQVYQALLESIASEHGSRMTSMSSATDNAGKMISSLTLSLNRARQAGITKEISEIVGGAEALKG
ncbi:MAG: ATP synthase F1 subunit gamma [Chthonomonadales bacterium]